MTTERRRFVAVDIETTGLDPVNDYIIEVGMAGETADFSYFEKTFSLEFPESAMSLEAAKINGWGQRPFAPVYDKELATAEIVANLIDCHMIGKNPQFDSMFLETLLKENWLERVWHHRLIDIGAMAWGYHQGHWAQWNKGQMTPGSKNVLNHPPDSSEVQALLNLNENDKQFHTALDDAVWCWEAFNKMAPLRA